MLLQGLLKISISLSITIDYQVSLCRKETGEREKEREVDAFYLFPSSPARLLFYSKWRMILAVMIAIFAIA